MEEGTPDEAASPLEEAIGAQARERYESALETLREEERDLARLAEKMGHEG